MAKIIKIQLSLLFFTTVVAFFAFYFQDSLPDHVYSISSSGGGYNFFTYYLTSLVAIIGYYTGPWIFFPFIFLAIFHAFIYSKRESWIDVFNVISLLLAFMTLSYLVFPVALGNGIRILLKAYIETPYLLLTCFLSWTLFFWGSFRSSFREGILTVLAGLWLISKKLFQLRKLITISPLSKIYSSTKLNAKMNFKGFLRGKNKPLENPVYEQEEEEQSVAFAPVLSPENLEPVEEESSPVEVELPVKEEPKSVLVPRPRRRVVSNHKYDQLVKGILAQKEKRAPRNPDQEYFDTITARIEEKLDEFKIDGRIKNILKGPVVDTFELELGAGVKVAKVTSITEDLSLALYGAPIRIVYPLKGRTTMGIEVPRNPREIIYLDEVLNTNEFRKTRASLPISMGKDAFGDPFIVDLASMPHMLVAGATGAGKSVFINTLLVSMLIKKSPKDMKLILIDPKQLELVLYSKLPHLLMPVITDAKKASLSLLWAVQEMERRYTILRELGVRNIDGFNEKLKDLDDAKLAKLSSQYEDFPEEEGYELPYIVIIVDEFADLILTKAGKEIENNICRLAGKARAAGIHLVLATQRPSVDVITGLIKSNFPTRVSFRVTTGIDSRTILSAQGAEKLLGKGDMLYKHGIEMSRLHSAYVDENEIEALVDSLSTVPGIYNDKAMDFLENGGDMDDDPYSFGSHIPSTQDGNEDDLYGEAVKIVAEHRSASASMLQRRLKIGYNRAANLIEIMESKGVVGPAQGSKPRKVLVSPENYV